MSDKNKEDIIDLGEIIRVVLSRKKVFYISLPIAFVISSLLIICVPRTYTTSSKLAPELGSSLTGGTLGSIASSFGIDLSQAETSDAISPLLYPDLMEDNGFVVSLFSIKVKSADGEINCSYYDYITKHQETAWWNIVMMKIRSLFPAEESPIGKTTSTKKDPYILSKRENDFVEMARQNITFSVDKQTGVITIATEAQDPLVCKILADSVTVRLQRFITEYRTNKARVDMVYYENLVNEAKVSYEQARQKYGSYADANSDVRLQSYALKQNDLENDMQLKFNTYSTLNTQLQAAIAKVQERTPAFTILKGANTPNKPSKPKRMLFVLGILVLTAVGDVLYILKDKIKNSLLKS